MLADSHIVAFIPTTDFARARAFYVGVLELHEVGQDAFALTVAAGGTNIRIARVETLTPAPFTILGWEVTDVAREALHLGSRGVVFERYPWFTQDALGIWTTPDGAQVAWFKDPDGNVLSISAPPPVLRRAPIRRTSTARVRRG
jgi:catechol 2,3-dioxygenase-like lactoylglutathione lyase family enzyme